MFIFMSAMLNYVDILGFKLSVEINLISFEISKKLKSDCQLSYCHKLINLNYVCISLKSRLKYDFGR